MRKIILLVLLLNSIVVLSGQKTTTDNPNSIVFKDTLFSIVTDLLNHNLGDIPAVNNKLVKYFKYIGKESVCIVKAWTSDPHFICEYPIEPLVIGKIYSFTVCFSNNGRVGHFNKVMGFDLSSGERIYFRFKANVVF
ncbi:MAG: hypothetical protein WCP69_14150 [Bacteroidota bacterium]